MQRREAEKFGADLAQTPREVRFCSQRDRLAAYVRKVVRHFERSGIVGPLTLEGRKLLADLENRNG